MLYSGTLKLSEMSFYRGLDSSLYTLARLTAVLSTPIKQMKVTLMSQIRAYPRKMLCPMPSEPLLSLYWTFLAWEWGHPSIATITAKVDAKCQRVQDSRTLLHEIGMVQWFSIL